MFESRFHFDPDTLRYSRVKRSLKSRILLGFLFGSVILILTAGMVHVTDNLGIRLKYKHLTLLNAELYEEYSILNQRMDRYEKVLAEYQLMDDSLYRCILGVEPVASFVRESGFGGSNQYDYLEGFASANLMINTSLRVDQIEIKTDIQNNSFSEIDRIAQDWKTLLGNKPAIQPISPENFYWLSSDFGYRIDPVTKVPTFHAGLDFAAEPGLEVYATGDGTVDFIQNSNGGYGKEIIIDHGFGYTSRYAHLQKILVQPGQKVVRGQIIAFLGNSGKSTGPHLHYGITYGDKHMNPFFYYSNDLTIPEYNKVISLAE